MSSPSEEEAGLNTPPKNNSLENTALNIESIFEADQKVEASKLLKQEQKVPNRGRLKRHRSTQESVASPQSKRARGLRTPLTDAAPQDPDKELESLIKETVRIVQAFYSEDEQEHLNKLARARAREDMKKHTKRPQEIKMQEPTCGDTGRRRRGEADR
ncbi:hypothetical protein FACUT_13210 [Fusarium acutatum]|uniref:Uncharacterized protein n=1 Tax=Fusarium acutatum TaxID=78861 RepID=A0A8H4JCD2_9HYPO|nr:hypothetical protein FACUT_13210 [Fusarium acutatum]